MNMMFAALVPLLIVSLLQLFVLWGLRLSVERIEAKLLGSSDGLQPIGKKDPPTKEKSG